MFVKTVTCRRIKEALLGSVHGGPIERRGEGEGRGFGEKSHFDVFLGRAWLEYHQTS